MATEPTGGKNLSTKWNMVHYDGVWKEHVRHENVSQRYRWPATWGYLVDEYRKMNCELAGRPISSHPTSTVYGAHVTKDLKLPSIPQRPGFPKTTNQEIGWRSTRSGKNALMVSIYGENRHGKCTINKRLNWPAAAF